jgi:hypothetical protein
MKIISLALSDELVVVFIEMTGRAERLLRRAKFGPYYI